MKLDVLLLTDVFENFRSVCLKNYGLDPCWYFTTPGLAWDACLKKTDVKLEFLNDVDMLLTSIRRISTSIRRISVWNTTSIRRISIWKKNRNLSTILMLTIFMVGLCHRHCLSVISSGWQKVNWRIGRQMERGVSLRLSWNIQKNFIISTTITPLLWHDWWWIKQKSWLLICGIRTSMFIIIGIWSNMKNWVWKSKRYTEESFSQKKHGWNPSSSWTLNFEQKPPTILKKISSSWSTIQYLEKL